MTKDFSDDNPMNVAVSIECNTGLPLQQQAEVSEFGNPFDFVEFVENGLPTIATAEYTCFNTRPSSRHGLALLVLLMLGVGFIAYRR